MALETGFKFKPDEKGIEDVLMQKAMGQFIDNAAGNIARAIKSRGPKHKTSFYDYRSSIEVVRAVATRDGMVGAVNVNSPGWHLPEYGTRRISATAPIRRGARDVKGVKFEEGSRS